MDWFPFLLLPGILLFFGQSLSHIEGSTRKLVICTSCDEFVGNNCRSNLGVCQPRYPDFACQAKDVYVRLYTGEYLYKYSILGCPRRCVEYMRLTDWEKNVFFCCNESYCNSLPTKRTIPEMFFLPENY